MSHSARLTVLAALLVLSLGCNSEPIPAYSLLSPPKETATLRESDNARCDLINEYLPGKDERSKLADGGGRTFVIPAGRCRLVVSYHSEGPSSRYAYGKEIEFDAVPLHEYEFNTYVPFISLDWFPRFERDEWDVQVIDRKTKQVMAETKDRKQPAP